jgi:calcineurin-like phosphoesterase family protein
MPELMDFAAQFCDFAICGHVHTAWTFKEVHVSHGRPTFLNVNVGCDQWKYRPISDDELMVAVNKYRKEKK